MKACAKLYELIEVHMNLIAAVVIGCTVNSVNQFLLDLLQPVVMQAQWWEHMQVVLCS